MRIYIIGNDGITLCREPPTTVNEGEIVVASSEELHAARLSGKRLLALWNALPGVGRRRKLGDRDALIEQLWSAIEALPDPDARRPSAAPTRGQAYETVMPVEEREWISPALASPDLVLVAQPPAPNALLCSCRAPDTL
jgi:hypothetical protein